MQLQFRPCDNDTIRYTTRVYLRMQDVMIYSQTINCLVVVFDFFTTQRALFINNFEKSIYQDQALKL
jgi:hypothetical protein